MKNANERESVERISVTRSKLWFFSLCWAIFPSVVFANPGTIEGDVYLLTKSGDVKPGAANEVALIPRAADLHEGWNALCKKQKQASRDQQAANEVMQASLENDVENAKNADAEKVARAKQIALLEGSIDAMVKGIREETRARAAWVSSHAVTTSPTGMNAHYRIETQPGEYWLFSQMPLGNVLHQWLIPISVEPGVQLTLDLDNNNTLEGKQFNCDHNPFPQ